VSGITGAFALAAAPAAQASTADRDRNRVPDRWERLSTHTNDAARDRNRDGLSNYAESARDREILPTPDHKNSPGR
jgi:hypothetical protein